MRLIEVSHRIVPGMKTYPGLPEPKVDVIVDYETSRERYGGKAEFFIASLHLCGNTGTYVDSPHHRYPTGVDLAELPLEQIAHVPAVVVDATSAGSAIGPEVFRGLELTGRAVLVRTDFSRHWGTDAYFTGHPFLSLRSVDVLVEAGPAFVGIDSLNIDDTADLRRPVHTTLLAQDIPIVEHLCGLSALPASGARFFAVPVKVKAFGTFPVRAFAKVG